MRLDIATLAFLGFSLTGAGDPAHAAADRSPETVEQVLARVWPCGPSVVIRSQALSRESELKACASLAQVEQRFHEVFGTAGKPVRNDGNATLSANIYRSKEDFQKYAGCHFDIPTDEFADWAAAAAAP